jgi:hypothetical protein
MLARVYVRVHSHATVAGCAAVDRSWTRCARRSIAEHPRSTPRASRRAFTQKECKAGHSLEMYKGAERPFGMSYLPDTHVGLGPLNS